MTAKEDRSLRALLETVPVGMAMASLDGRLIATNRAFLEMLGYSREELVGLSVYDLTHQGDIEQTAENLHRIPEIGTMRFDKRFLRKDGSAFWARVTARCVEQPSGPVSVAVIEDIDATYRAEQALAATRMTQGALLDALPDMIFRLDENGCYLEQFRGAPHPRIHVTAQASGRMWTLAVEDNGVGLDLRHARLIFQIFKRLHASDRYSGTGVGLAICKKIVERHHGRIWVESTPDQGATFLFTLPAARTRKSGSRGKPA